MGGAPEVLPCFVMGLLLGALASLLNVFFVKGEMRTDTCNAFILGGAVGGGLASMFLPSFADISRQDLLIIALCGYFFADLAATLTAGGARKG